MGTGIPPRWAEDGAVGLVPFTGHQCLVFLPQCLVFTGRRNKCRSHCLQLYHISVNPLEHQELPGPGSSRLRSKPRAGQEAPWTPAVLCCSGRLSGRSGCNNLPGINTHQPYLESQTGTADAGFSAQAFDIQGGGYAPCNQRTC